MIQNQTDFGSKSVGKCWIKLDFKLIQQVSEVSLYSNVTSELKLSWSLNHWQIWGLFPINNMQAPLRYGPMYMEDAQWAETNEKNNFPTFAIYISRVIVKIHRKLTIFRTKMTKNDHHSKNKNLKFDFYFYSADSESFM